MPIVSSDLAQNPGRRTGLDGMLKYLTINKTPW
jgi:hypothetical protein